MKIWESDVQKRVNGCREAVKATCNHTYELSGEIVLAYLTKSCDVREVTAQDIDEDLERFALAGLTHADRLKHAQLKETITVCKEAAKASYAWRYFEPSQNDCPEVPATRKK